MATWVVDAILFDLDGTLVDSAGSVERSWRQLADKIGRPWAEVRPHIHGVPVPQVMAMLEPDMAAERVEQLRVFMVESESTDTVGPNPAPPSCSRRCRRSGWASSPAVGYGWPAHGSPRPVCRHRAWW
jgi:beta-phosphoglucomutase-like phosphatase (HAD superfamily)